MTLQLWEYVAGSALIVATAAGIGEGLSRLLRRAGRRAGIKDTTLVWIRDAARVIWVVVAVVGVAYFTNLTSELTLLAVSTVGGLILSLGLQATLSNVIAGIFMLEDGTLRVGDEITFSGVKGKVVRISLRTSWVMTEKGVLAVVSNSNLMTGPLLNHTGTTRLVKRYHLHGELPLVDAGSATAENRAGNIRSAGSRHADGTLSGKRVGTPTGSAGDPGET